MVERGKPDRLQIALERRIRDRGADAGPGERLEPRPDRLDALTTVNRSTRPTLLRLCRASTRTRLASCIGLSG